jgi:hypothetical protein
VSSMSGAGSRHPKCMCLRLRARVEGVDVHLQCCVRCAVGGRFERRRRAPGVHDADAAAAGLRHQARLLELRRRAVRAPAARQALWRRALPGGAHKQTDRQTDRQKDRQKDRQTDRQTDMLCCRSSICTGSWFLACTCRQVDRLVWHLDRGLACASAAGRDVRGAPRRMLGGSR